MTSDVSNNIGCALQRSFSLQPSSTPICQQFALAPRTTDMLLFPFFSLLFSPLSLLKDMLKYICHI